MSSLASPPTSLNGLTDTVSTSFPSPELAFTPRRFVRVVGPCAAVFVAVLLIVPWIGSTGISFSRVWAGSSPDVEIFLLARLPRILFGALAGGSLAVSGVLFQAMLRNSLATPFTLGVSSGASFGAVVAIGLGFDTVLLGVPIVALAAFAGALMAIVLVFRIARTADILPTFTLLLAGVTLNFVFAALITAIHYVSNFQQSYLMVRWMMGSLDSIDAAAVGRVAPVVLITALALMRIVPALNPMAAGDEWATARGVNVDRVKRLAYFGASLLTGAITAYAGPIGFVGLIVPHALRLISGPDNRTLAAGSFFLGGAFLMLCDTAARTMFAPTELPVGVLTALIGGPVFIALLRRNRGELW